MGAPTLPDAIRKLLFGTPFGEVYPAREPPPPLALDGRTVALRLLRRYLAALTFYRTGATVIDPETRQPTAGAPVAFAIPENSIHIEWPDYEEDLVFPCISLLATAPAEMLAIGLTGYVEENSRDVFAPGTIVQWMSEYKENIALEIWASSKAERRAILSGLEAALSPTEQMYGLRFSMPDYFNELVCFTVSNREIFEDPDAARNRRRARLMIEMRFNLVALVNYNPLVGIVKVEVDVDQDTNEAVVLVEESERARERC